MIDQGFAQRGGTIDRAFACCCSAWPSRWRWRRRRASIFVSLLGERVVADLRAAPVRHLLALDAGFFEPHPQRRTGLAPVRRHRTAAQRGRLQHVGRAAQRRDGARQHRDAVRHQPAPGGVRAGRHPAGRAADRASAAGACRRSRAPARTASPTPTRSPAKRSARCAPCRRMRANPTSAGASPTRVATAVATARKRIGVQAIVTAVAITLFFGAITLVLWSGAHDVVAGRMSAGTLGQFVLYAMIGGGSVGALAEVWNEVQRAAGGMGRINELLQERPAGRARACRAAAAAGARRDPPSTTSPSTTPSRAGRACAGRLQPARAARRNRGAGRPFRRRQEHGVLAAAALPRSATPAASAIDGIDMRAARPGRAARSHRAGAAGSRRSSPPAPRDNIRYGRLEAERRRGRAAARSAEAARLHRRPAAEATTANSANAARACPAASSNASPSRARC